MKKLLTMLLFLSMVLRLFSITAYAAPEWPSSVSVQAEGAIVIDANSGAVLFGQNIHKAFYPASITKVLTALITIEQCDLDEIVTFSHDAVYNVESGSSNMGMDEGDTLTVKDCLYGLMLASANESANALAEHIAGSREAFADIMNQKAAELGCRNTHFANPSGLNGEDHYTTAYDMALICQAAIQNETFLEIDATLKHDLPPTRRFAEGSTIYAHHKMLKKNESVYYPGIFGGKTGYTSKAGNTLVTFAEKNGLTLIAVILNGGGTHYSDTKALFDFGFENFQNVKIADYDSTYSSLENDMTIAGLSAGSMSGIYLDKDKSITLPKTADFSDATSSISFDLAAKDPAGSIAKLQYLYGDRPIGTAYLMSTVNQKDTSPLLPAVAPTVETTAAPPTETTAAVPPPDTKVPFRIPSALLLGIGVVLAFAAVIGIIIAIKIHANKKEEAERRLRQERRARRLQEIGLSSSEFDLLMDQKRNTYAAKNEQKQTNIFGK